MKYNNNYTDNDCHEYANTIIAILNDIQIQLQQQAQVQEQIQKQLQEQAQVQEQIQKQLQEQIQLQQQNQDQDQDQKQLQNQDQDVKNTNTQAEIETEKSTVTNKSKSKTVIGDIGNHIKVKNSLEDESSVSNSYLLILLFLVSKGDKDAYKELKDCYPKAAKRLENFK